MDLHTLPACLNTSGFHPPRGLNRHCGCACSKARLCGDGDTLLLCVSYQRDDGALCSELSSAEQRPDEAVDLPLLWVMLVVVQWNLRFLDE